MPATNQLKDANGGPEPSGSEKRPPAPNQTKSRRNKKHYNSRGDKQNQPTSAL